MHVARISAELTEQNHGFTPVFCIKHRFLGAFFVRVVNLSVRMDELAIKCKAEFESIHLREK